MTTDLRQRAASLRGRLPERRQSRPPEENGQRLACIQRGPDEELRVHWSTYEGKPFLSIRIWTRDQQGGWWPDGKRGVAIRVREMPDFAEALSEALELADRHVAQGGRQPARGGAPRNRGDSPDVSGRQAINEAFRPSGGGDEFSEFAGPSTRERP
jgi:hypothetical protein